MAPAALARPGPLPLLAIRDTLTEVGVFEQKGRLR